MGCYDDEMELVRAGRAERGKACRDYFAEFDAGAPPEMLPIHRPDYSKTLFAPESDDIYRELCAFLDQAEPRHYDEVDDPLRIEGFTAADVYFNMINNNKRQARLVVERGLADEVAGCCRVNHQKLAESDVAVALCCNCMAMIDEDADNERLDYLYALIDADDGFPLLDWGGVEMGLQDCGRAYDRPELHDAIRSLLAKMNVRVVELPDARERSVFCGPFALVPAPKQDAGFAPRRYTEDLPARGVFVEGGADPEAAMREHAEAIPTDLVACYCTGCHAGLEMGGKRAVNVLELVCGTAGI